MTFDRKFYVKVQREKNILIDTRVVFGVENNENFIT
jgi:hypothetical protein